MESYLTTVISDRNLAALVLPWLFPGRALYIDEEEDEDTVPTTATVSPSSIATAAAALAGAGAGSASGREL